MVGSCHFWRNVFQDTLEEEKGENYLDFNHQRSFCLSMLNYNQVTGRGRNIISDIKKNGSISCLSSFGSSDCCAEKEMK
jgi:hypothetical protein